MNGQVSITLRSVLYCVLKLRKQNEKNSIPDSVESLVHWTLTFAWEGAAAKVEQWPLPSIVDLWPPVCQSSYCSLLLPLALHDPGGTGIGLPSPSPLPPPADGTLSAI